MEDQTSGQDILRNVDPNTPFLTQLQKDEGPIVLINTFIVPEGEMTKMVEIWRKDSMIMKSIPGFISAQLHQGIDGSNILINMAVWESTAALRNGFMSDEFQAIFAEYPVGTVAYPHILRKVAVKNVCTA